MPALPGVTLIPLSDDAPLAREWFIVVDHERFGAALLTRQLGEVPTRVTRKAIAFGRGRLYEGVLTFDDQWGGGSPTGPRSGRGAGLSACTAFA